MGPSPVRPATLRLSDVVTEVRVMSKKRPKRRWVRTVKTDSTHPPPPSTPLDLRSRTDFSIATTAGRDTLRRSSPRHTSRCQAQGYPVAQSRAGGGRSSVNPMNVTFSAFMLAMASRSAMSTRVHGRAARLVVRAEAGRDRRRDLLQLGEAGVVVGDAIFDSLGGSCQRERVLVESLAFLLGDRGRGVVSHVGLRSIEGRRNYHEVGSSARSCYRRARAVVLAALRFDPREKREHALFL